MSTENLHSALLAVKELIKTPETWTHGALARDVDGCQTYARGPYAYCWCLLGAIEKVGIDSQLHSALYYYLQDILVKFISNDMLSYYNDVRGFDAVHKLLDIAIIKSQV